MIKLLGQYKNGNYTTKIFNDGTRIRFTDDDYFKAAFAENIDVKITNCCDLNCQFCHENSNINGKHGDIEKFFDTLHPYQEIALGGGNILYYPKIRELLQKLRDKKVITNITLNQKHFMDNINTLLEWYTSGLYYGLGVSFTHQEKNFLHFISLIPNSVVHIINGVINKDDLNYLSNHDIKLLILGYKQLRRGQDFYNKYKEDILINQKYLSDNILNLFKKFKVVSFDNLALKQLDLKNKLSKEVWQRFYQGDDGSSTFYIDLVNKEFAKSSTSMERYKLLDNVDDMFKVIQNSYEKI